MKNIQLKNEKGQNIGSIYQIVLANMKRVKIMLCSKLKSNKLWKLSKQRINKHKKNIG